MKKALSVILGLLVSSASANNLPTFFLAVAPQNGEVPLTRSDAGSYYTSVDLKNLNPKSPNDDPETTALMTPILYTHQSLLSPNCYKFKPYKCANYEKCKPSEDVATANYLNFKATGKLAATEIFLDYKNWAQNSQLIIADQCSDYVEGTETLGEGVSGLLALGTTDKAKDNFIGSKDFSFYFDKDGKTGKLFFSFKKDLVSSDTPIATLTADKNWQIADVNGVNVDKEHQDLEGLKLIFDVNTERIGLPQALYDKIAVVLKDKFKVECKIDVANPLPVCAWKDTVKNLPKITFTTVSKQEIILPPQLYVVNGNDDSVKKDNIVLNIQVYSPQGKGQAFVLPDYQNHIILGSSFLRNYYTKFSITDQANNINIYNFKQSSGSPGGSYWWVYVLIALVVVGGGVAFYMKKVRGKGVEDIKDESKYGALH